MTTDSLVIFIMLIILLYTWYLVFVWHKKVKEQEKKTEESINKSFSSLREKIEKQVEMLDGEPGLNDEERRIRDMLYETIKESEEKMKEEVKK